jgi:hypothetical protein
MSDEPQVTGGRHQRHNGHNGRGNGGSASTASQTPKAEVPRSPEVQRQYDLVAQRRDDLSQTVAALADKFDVKARTKEAVSDLRTSAGRQLRPDRLLTALAAVGTVVAAVSAIVYASRRARW